MKILHLLASPVWSGPAENVALLAGAQRSLGHEVQIAVDRKRPSPPFEEPSVPKLRALELLDEGGLELCVKSLPWRMVADVMRLRHRALDVVHAHFSHDHFLARWGRPFGAKLVRSIHSPRSLGRGLPAADGFTVPTAADAARVPGRAIVLPPLVGCEFVPPADRAALRRELGIQGSPVVGMVSTFQASRRHDLGLTAFAALRARAPGAQLLLVADGVLGSEIRARVAREQLAGVVFTGYQSGAAFVRWLQALDTVWVLGLGNDFSGRAAAQARACGVRVVAVDEGALRSNADELLPELKAEAVVAATLREGRGGQPTPSNEGVAREVLELYAACGAGA